MNPPSTNFTLSWHEPFNKTGHLCDEEHKERWVTVAPTWQGWERGQKWGWRWLFRERRHSIFAMTHTDESISNKMQRRHEERCCRKRIFRPFWAWTWLKQKWVKNLAVEKEVKGESKDYIMPPVSTSVESWSSVSFSDTEEQRWLLWVVNESEDCKEASTGKMTLQTESFQFSVIREALNKQEGIELYLSNSLLIWRWVLKM